MQPTYLPWSGYFSLIKSVDKFIFLDDVQFNRDSWQCLNQILLNSKPHKLKVPTLKKPLKTSISEIKINNSTDWRLNHLNDIKQAYSKNKDFNLIENLINEIYTETNYDLLVNLNSNIIQKIANILEINTEFIKASSLNVDGFRSGHVANICYAVNAETYISPLGAKQYLMEDQFKQKYDLELLFHSFTHTEYEQNTRDQFITHLSFIDCLASIGINDSNSTLDNYKLLTI